MKIFKRHICLFAFYLITVKQVFSQAPDPLKSHSFVNCTASVEKDNLHILLKVKLSTSENKKIQILKARYFVESNCNSISFDFVSGEIYLQKLIQNTYVTLTTDALRHPSYDPDFDKQLIIDYSNPHSDTIYLEEMYPFEKGKYRVGVTLYYYYEKSKFPIHSELENFEVDTIPGNAPMKNKDE